MKKFLKTSGLIIILLFLFGNIKSQSIDTVIHTDIYTSYFNYQLHEPLFVSYTLYKGGGNCSRSGMTFKTGGLNNSATEKDYAHNGYDEGHLANAEDFAFDCNKERETFFYFNCVPQTPRLNRGIWKVYEEAIREKSQFDSLQIICGSIFGKKKIGNIVVPDYCWKIVYSLSKKEFLYCVIFPNDNSDTVKYIELNDLINLFNYKIDFSFVKDPLFGINNKSSTFKKQPFKRDLNDSLLYLFHKGRVSMIDSTKIDGKWYRVWTE